MKWILKYLRDTSIVGLKFGDNQSVLDGYTNVDMAGNIEHRKSTARYFTSSLRGNGYVV